MRPRLQRSFGIARSLGALAHQATRRSCALLVLNGDDTALHHGTHQRILQIHGPWHVHGRCTCPSQFGGRNKDRANGNRVSHGFAWLRMASHWLRIRSGPMSFWAFCKTVRPSRMLSGFSSSPSKDVKKSITESFILGICVWLDVLIPHRRVTASVQRPAS